MDAGFAAGSRYFVQELRCVVFEYYVDGSVRLEETVGGYYVKSM
jgi:hypothetical protein